MSAYLCMLFTIHPPVGGGLVFNTSGGLATYLIRKALWWNPFSRPSPNPAPGSRDLMLTLTYPESPLNHGLGIHVTGFLLFLNKIHSLKVICPRMEFVFRISFILTSSNIVLLPPNTKNITKESAEISIKHRFFIHY